MQISVVIPTYNRAEVLRKTLQAYAEQSGAHGMLELIVVDDGSRDETPSVVEEFIRSSDLPIRYLYQANAGLAAARNVAVREARGELILFGDDDIMPSKFMVAEHAAWHARHPEPHQGMLGFVTWAPAVHATPFMMWSGLYGPQFNFGYFKDGQELTFLHGYFCNTSVKLQFVKQHGEFDESLRTYGYEDIEFSFRLMQRGYQLFYDAAAFGYHNKYESFDDTLSRVEKLYASWPGFAHTAAGKEYLRLWMANRAASASKVGSAAKQVLRPIKRCAVPLLRPLLDTRFPLPRWLYDQILYHYVTDFRSFLNESVSQASPGMC